MQKIAPPSDRDNRLAIGSRKASRSGGGVAPHDLFFMRQAIRLAKGGLGRVHPNPLVGAVLVSGQKVLGRGSHRFFGGPHAEVNAISKLKILPKNTTLYVTLEPCAHSGKTPPCVDLILRRKIRKVVIGAMDANPLVSGKGVRCLKKAGVNVIVGVLGKEAQELNQDFSHWIRRGRPYVTVKAAQTLDGKIATQQGESKWITGAVSRKRVQELRAKADAVLVGVNTVIKDNPLLSVRLKGYPKQPLRIVLDTNLRTPLAARLFSKISSGPVLIVAGSHVSKAKQRQMEKKAEVWLVKEKSPGRIDWNQLLRRLGERGIVNLLIEGGGEVIGSALAEKIVQEVYFFVAPKILGGKGAISSTAGLNIGLLKNAVGIRNLRAEKSGEDILIHGRI